MSPLEPSIGATLRDTRIRRKVDLAQVESETKIRVRYLRALENEEWDVLPGGAYTRSFIRTYAGYLGLDGERLADTYRREFEQTQAERPPRHDPVPVSHQPRGGGGGRISRGTVAALVSIALIGTLIVIGLLSGGSESGDTTSARGGHRGSGARPVKHPAKQRSGVTLSLRAEADVWVCLLAADGKRLIAGEVLPAGTERGPFRSGRFRVAFGNGSVALKTNGRRVPLADSPNPIGYQISPNGTAHPIPGSARPTCE